MGLCCVALRCVVLCCVCYVTLRYVTHNSQTVLCAQRFVSETTERISIKFGIQLCTESCLVNLKLVLIGPV